MQEQIHDLFSLLTSPGMEVPVGRRMQAAQTASTMINSWHLVNEAFAADVIKTLSQHRDNPSPYKGAMIASMLYALTKNEEHLAALAEHLAGYEPDISEGIASLNTLGSMLFNAAPGEDITLKAHIGRKLQRELFEKILIRYQLIADAVFEKFPAPYEDNNKVVILAKQLLRPPHAPTSDALSFASRLTKHHKKEVFLLVNQELPNSFDGAVAPCARFNVQPEFMGANTFSHDGAEIRLAYLSDGPINEEIVARQIATVASLNPEMIISVGAPSFLGEVFAASRFCFQYPTVRGIPITRNCYFHSWDSPDEEMQEIVKAEKLEGQYLFAQHPGFDRKPASTALTRTELNLPEDAFIFVVVGMRLDKDVDDEFCTMLERVVENEQVHIAFSGHFETCAEQMEKFPLLKERCTHIGFQDDIMAVYNISDAFLNPNRKGGGSAIVYAMQADLPVLSLPFGDAGMAASAFPSLEDYTAMAQKALELVESNALQDEYKTLAKQEGERFSNRNYFTDRMVAEFEKYKQARTQAS